jgi:hypothetical protein
VWDARRGEEEFASSSGTVVRLVSIKGLGMGNTRVGLVTLYKYKTVLGQDIEARPQAMRITNGIYIID